jgi:hypothetical protein
MRRVRDIATILQINANGGGIFVVTAVQMIQALFPHIAVHTLQAPSISVKASHR